jgi:hypothetical protein
MLLEHLTSLRFAAGVALGSLAVLVRFIIQIKK